MDKYEYKIKLDEIKTLANAQKFEEAAEIVDTINWRKIRNVNSLVKAGEIYAQVGRYEEGKEILLMAYDRSPIGRMIIYRLAEIAIMQKEFDEAQEYYDEFVQIAPHDNQRYILRYDMLKARGADIDALIEVLEEYKEQEYTEKWAYELAYLYHASGKGDKCIAACDELILWFGDGPYVEKALELKMLYQPLSKSQEDKYRAFKQREAGVIEIRPTDMLESGEIVRETIQIPQVVTNAGRFNTVNLQQVIADSMQQIKDATEKETVHDTMDNIKKIVEEIPYLQIPTDEESEEDIYSHIETDEEIDGSLKINFQELLGEEHDGQMSLVVPHNTVTEKQITGQMNIQEVLDEWDKTRYAAEMALAEAEQRKLESAKAKALAEAGGIMERLTTVIPQLEAGVTPKELLEQKYLGRAAALDSVAIAGIVTKNHPAQEAEQILANMNNMLQQQIDELSRIEEEERLEEQRHHETIEETQEEIPQEEPEDMSMQGFPEQEFIEPVEAEPTLELENAEEEMGAEEEEVADLIAQMQQQIEQGEAEARAYVAQLDMPHGSSTVGELLEELSEELPSEQIDAIQEAILEEQEPVPEVVAPEDLFEEPLMEQQETEDDLQPQEEDTVTEDISQQEEEHLEDIVPKVAAPEDLFDDLKQEQPLTQDMSMSEAVNKEELFGAPQTGAYEAPREEGIAGTTRRLPTLEELDRGAMQRTIGFPDVLSAMDSELQSAAVAGVREEKLPKIADPEEIIEQSSDMITSLTDKQKEIFTYFTPVAGMEAQLCRVLSGVKKHCRRSMTSNAGNIIIEGVQGSGKTMLATCLVKALQDEVGRPSSNKVGKIDAVSLNQKDVTKLMKMVAGGCLIVEQAGKLTRETTVRLSLAMEADTSGLLVIIEDTKEGIQKVLSQDDSFARKFTETIKLPMFTIDELVEFAKKYANEMYYEIDEMAILALYNRISRIQKVDQATTLIEIKDIVDEAIARAERFSMKKAFGMLSAKRKENDFGILHEKDFDE